MPTITTPTSDGGELVTLTSDSGVVETITKLDASGNKVFENIYRSDGSIAVQEGFSASGSIATEVVRDTDGLFKVVDFDSSGKITLQYGFNSSGLKLYANIFNPDGSSEVDGYSASGNVTFVSTITGNGASTPQTLINTFISDSGIVVSQTFLSTQFSTNVTYQNFFDPQTGAIISHREFSSILGVGHTTTYATDGSQTTVNFDSRGRSSFEAHYDAQGKEVWANVLDLNSGGVLGQYGFASNGVIIAEIDHTPSSVLGGPDPTVTTHWTSAGVLVDQTALYGDGGRNFVQHYDANGILFERDVYTSTSPHTLQTVETFNTAGVLVLQAGYSGSVEAYLNGYDPNTGALQYQLGYDARGVMAAEIDHAGDGSSDTKSFDGSAHLLTITGFSAGGQETYANAYDPSSGLLLSQVGFANGVKAVEIDHAADGSFSTSQFSSAGLTQETFFSSTGSVLETLTRDPTSGVYTLNGAVGGVTLTAIPGAGTLTAGGTATTFAVAQGFGSATVSNFVAAGAGSDLIQVDTHLAVDYSHLLADAQNSGSDVVFTFNSHDQLTLHGVQIAQLSSSDFLFV